MTDIVTTTHAINFAVADDVEIFAIGDIHGRVDLFSALLDHAASLPRIASRRIIVQTGDLIDRGPDSLGALHMAMGMKDRAKADVQVNLMGNHEMMAAVAMTDGNEDHRYRALDVWRANGGYGVFRELLGDDEATLAGRGVIKSAFGPDRLAFLRAMPSHWSSRDVMFVHAGLPPQSPPVDVVKDPWDIDLRSLHEDRHWAWIRRPFLERSHHDGLFIVHGHTYPDGIRRRGADTVAQDRVNLDLGSYDLSMARMVRLIGNQLTVFDAIGDDVARGPKVTKRFAGERADHIARVMEDR